MNNKVLFLVQLPSPVHGASLVNKSIKDSDLINSHISTKYVDTSLSKGNHDLGKVSLSKFFNIFRLIFCSVYSFISFRPKIVYMAIGTPGLAVIKDGIIVLILKAIGAKFVFHIHGKGVDKAVNRSRFMKGFYQRVFKGCDVVHLSEMLFSDLDSIRDHSCSIYEVNNGIEDFGTEKKKYSPVPTFVYLSNFIREKGCGDLLDELETLDCSFKGEFRFKLIGGVPDSIFYAEIKRKVQASKFSEYIELCAPLYGDDKHELLKNTDVFVLPTRYKIECFPLSILEAMSHSMAIISTKEGAIPSMIEVNDKSKQCGSLVDLSKVGELREAIEMYLREPDSIKAHGNNSRDRYVSNYTQGIFEERLLGVLNNICSGTK